MHEYKTARSVCGFVEFCAWAGVVVAVLIALMAIAAGSSRGGSVALVALVPAFSLALASFIVIVMVQMARASMDNSVTSQKLMEQSQRQHQELLSAVRQGATTDVEGFAERERSADIEQEAETPPQPPEEPEVQAELGPPKGTKIIPELFRQLRGHEGTKQLDYRGTMILDTPHGGFIWGLRFDSAEEAKRYIDHSLEPVIAKQIEASPPEHEHKGFTIVQDGNVFRTEGMGFESLELAQQYLDRRAVTSQGSGGFQLTASRPPGLG